MTHTKHSWGSVASKLHKISKPKTLHTSNVMDGGRSENSEGAHINTRCFDRTCFVSLPNKQISSLIFSPSFCMYMKFFQVIS